MKIGDKVRLLRGTEEGIIVNIKGDKIVEIEIEDGFVIPTMKNEVVVIDKSEGLNFSKDEKEEIPKQNKRPSGHISKGIFIGLFKINDNLFQTYLINNSDDDVLFSISQYNKKSISGKFLGICKQFETIEIGELTSSIFNESKKLLVQIIFHETQTKFKKIPLSAELGINKHQINKTTYIESIEKDLAVIKIDESPGVEVNPLELKEKLFESNTLINQYKDSRRQPIYEEIDLHIEALSNFSQGFNSNEILSYQLSEFEKAYDNALLSNSEKLKVIHGVGSGILRSEIHKRLTTKNEVKYFEDGDKEKFGFGSTIIYL